MAPGVVGLVLALGPPASLGGEEPSAARLLRALDAPIERLEGRGELHYGVCTDSAEAQRFFDQGLALRFSYDWVAAARSFRQALRADPGLPAAHLGLARALLELELVDRADAEFGRARAALGSRRCSAGEARWIALEWTQYQGSVAPGPETHRVHERYKAGLAQWAEQQPEEPLIPTLQGNAEEPEILGRGQGGREGSIAFYRAALEVDPSWFPAHHFLAHSFENLGRPREAAHHARRYAELAPGQPHAQHMRGHTLPALGEWRAARRSFERADRLHRRTSSASGAVPPELDWHYAHNLRLLALTELYLGDGDAALRHAEKLEALATDRWRRALHCELTVDVLLALGRSGDALAAGRGCARPDRLGAVFGLLLQARASIHAGRREEAVAMLHDGRRRVEWYLGRLQRGAGPTQFQILAPRTISHAELELGLTGTDPAATGRAVREWAEVWAGETSFDRWGPRLVRIQGLEALARRAGLRELADDLRALIERRDPPVEPLGFAGPPSSPAGLR